MTDNIMSKTTLENEAINNKLKQLDIKFHFNLENIKNNKIIFKLYQHRKDASGWLNQGLRWTKDDQIYRPNI